MIDSAPSGMCFRKAARARCRRTLAADSLHCRTPAISAVLSSSQYASWRMSRSLSRSRGQGVLDGDVVRFITEPHNSGGAEFVLQRLLAVPAPVGVAHQVAGHGQQPGHVRARFVAPLLPHHAENVGGEFLRHFGRFHPPAHKAVDPRIAVFVNGDKRQFALGKHDLPLKSCVLSCRLTVLFPAGPPGLHFPGEVFRPMPPSRCPRSGQPRRRAPRRPARPAASAPRPATSGAAAAPRYRTIRA